MTTWNPVRVSNTTPASLDIWIEPQGDRVTLQPGEHLDLDVPFDEKLPFELSIREDCSIALCSEASETIDVPGSCRSSDAVRPSPMRTSRRHLMCAAGHAMREHRGDMVSDPLEDHESVPDAHTFADYNALEAFLRHWRQWGDPCGPYDINGAIHLLGAVADNLGQYAAEDELNEFVDSLTSSQRATLRRLLAAAPGDG